MLDGVDMKMDVSESVVSISTSTSAAQACAKAALFQSLSGWEMSKESFLGALLSQVERYW